MNKDHNSGQDFLRVLSTRYPKNLERTAQSQRVVHISYSSSGGAVLAAARLVAAQQAFGIEAEFWSISDANLMRRPLENPTVTLAAVAEKDLVLQFGADLSKNYPH
jgi:hypothetical protein